MQTNHEVLRSSVRIRRKKISQVLCGLGFFLMALFILTNYLFHLDGLYIRGVYIKGNYQVGSSQILQVVKEVFRGRYYGMYPKSNILIYPKEDMEREIAKRLPWIAGVNVSAGKGAVIIEVKERVPKYLRCDDLDKPMLERTCYYLDETGFAFSVAPSFSGHIYPEFYGGDKRGGYYSRYILPKELFDSINRVRISVEEQINKKRYPSGEIYGIYIHNNGDYDLLLNDSKREWKIFFDLDIDPVKKLDALLDSPFFKKELDEAGGKIEYIDLRFGKKVFYKFSS